MTETGQDIAARVGHSVGDADGPIDPFAEILSLARAGGSPSRFMGDVLRCIGRFFRSPYAAIHLRYASEVFQDECHFGSGDPRFWKSTLQALLTESLAEVRSRAKVLKAKSSHQCVALLSVPMFDALGPAIGAVALVVEHIEPTKVETCLARLESLLRFASLASHQQQPAGSRGPALSVGMVQAEAHAARCDSVTELAYALTNELRNKLGCEQVALGIVQRRRIKIISISGLDEVKKQSPGVVTLTGAMEECLDAGVSMGSQREGGWAGGESSASYRLHKQWHAAVKGDSVASIPLRVDGRIMAVLSLRQRTGQSITPELVEQIRQRVEPFIPALGLLRRANRHLIAHGIDSIREILISLTEPGRMGRRIAAVLAVCFVGWFLFGHMQYQLAVPAAVRPAEVRHLTVPFEGVLMSARAVEGDLVSKGDVLCEFDKRDLEQEHARLMAEMKVLDHSVDQAMAVQSPVEVELARAQQSLIQTKLDILNRRLEQAVVRAPMDGVIVAGDLRRLVGSVQDRGAALFQIAPLNRWTLEIEVPDNSSADLAAGLPGMFAGNARPEDRCAFHVSRVLGTAQLRESRNVYIAEAQIDEQRSWIRSGMEGVARVDMGSKPVWWVVLRRALDYLRVHFWL